MNTVDTYPVPECRIPAHMFLNMVLLDDKTVNIAVFVLLSAFSERWQPRPLRLLGVSYSALVGRRVRYISTYM